ncbi:transcription elongation factor Elf1 [Lutibacter sp. SG786]|nr:transcription elongation factor Elf1 [Luteibacter sp. SG786]
MSEILNCPFCGHEAEFIQDTCEAYVECTNGDCGACSGNFGYHSGDQKAQAIAAWNTRTGDAK